MEARTEEIPSWEAGMKGGRNCVNWENLIEKRKIFAALTDIFS